MDPNTDLTPMNTQHSDNIAVEPPPSNHAHPPYAEMITAAISALKDKDGSSRQAISKYIEKEYPNLPPTHASLLTHHLKRLKNEGQLEMVKHSYVLSSRSGPFQPPTSTNYNPTLDFTVNSNAGGVNLENSSGLSKRKPGRPRKVQEPLQNVQAFEGEVPSYQPQFQYNVGVGQDFPVQSNPGGGANQDIHLNYGPGSDFQGNSAGSAEPLFASLGLGDDGVAPPPPENISGVVKRGRGRPPKVAAVSGGDVAGTVTGGDVAGTVTGGDDLASSGGEIETQKTVYGRPIRKPKTMSIITMGANGGRIKKGRGRPRRIGIGAVTVPLSGNVMRPRGRPKRGLGKPMLRPAQNVGVNGGVSESGLAPRRPGRPSLSNGSARPLGRPSKDGSGTAVVVTDPRELVVYQELKNKYELLQSKVKQVASVVKGCIDPNYGRDALGALHELEAMVGVEASSHMEIEAAAPY